MEPLKKATKEQVQDLHTRVARYKYGYLQKLEKYSTLSYTRISKMVRADEITEKSYINIMQALDKFEKKYPEYILSK